MSQLTLSDVIVISVLNEVDKRFPDNTAENVRELIFAGESGIALEVSCAQLFEYSIIVSNRNKNKLKNAANLMRIPLLQLEGLE